LYLGRFVFEEESQHEEFITAPAATTIMPERIRYSHAKQSFDCDPQSQGRPLGKLEEPNQP
jgi:hypothetical protein